MTTLIMQDPAEMELFNCARSTVEPFICRFCEFTTHLLRCYNEHVQKFHWKKQEVGTINFKLKLYTCDDCPFETFSSLVWLKNHGDGCAAPGEIPKRFQCEHCDYKAKWKQYLQRHILHRHTREEDIEWFYCTFCVYKTKRKGTLNRHTLVRHLSEEYINWFHCTQCAFRSKELRGLKNHIKNKHECKEFKCEKCEYIGKSLHRLNKHIIRKHETIRWYNCDQCDYRTRKSDNLRRHNNSQHIADDQAKWYRCTQCEFMTKQPDGVKRHVRYVHHLVKRKRSNLPNPLMPRERQFPCERCDYKARTKSTLRQHMINKHVESKWYLCDKCAYKSKKSTNLTRHINSRHLTDECAKWFQCNLCDFRTKHSENVKKHMKKKHEVVEVKDEGVIL